MRGVGLGGDEGVLGEIVDDRLDVLARDATSSCDLWHGRRPMTEQELQDRPRGWIDPVHRGARGEVPERVEGESYFVNQLVEEWLSAVGLR